MQVADFISAAGVDPHERAEAILSARPGEVSALGDAFVAAAEALTSSGGLSSLAGELADASAVFDGASATDLMAEVSAVQETLAASPPMLLAIGGPLQDLAGTIAMAQQQASAVLMDFEEQAVAVILEYEAHAADPTMGGPAWHADRVAAGAQLVVAADAALEQIVNDYDANLADVLATLQAAGYLLPPDVDAGLVAPGGVAADLAAHVPLFPGLTGQAAPADEWWASLSLAQQAVLLQAYPEAVATMRGLPARVQHAANVRAIVDDEVDLDQQIADVAQQVWDDPWMEDVAAAKGIGGLQEIAEMTSSELMELQLAMPMSTALLSLIALREKKETIDGVQASATPGADGRARYVLDYDLDAHGGDGAAVIAIGEVDLADDVAIVVQGANHDLGTITAQTDDAEAILAEMDNLEEGGEHAVIVYAGYDNPTPIESPFTGRVDYAAQVLAADLAGYEAAHEQASGGSDAHTTIIGHSYGTIVTAEALRQGGSAYVDDAILYGSPGVAVESIEELGMSSGHVYAAMDDGDFLPYAGCAAEALLGHGLLLNTTEPGFGATIIGTEGVHGHGDYFGYENGEANETLRGAAAVAVIAPLK